MKIRARETEQDAELVLGQHRGVDHDARPRCCASAIAIGSADPAPEQPANQIGARGLVEHRIDDFQRFDVAQLAALPQHALQR